MCREVCPDNPCLDENTLRAKHPYVMLSSCIYPCGGETEHLQIVQKRYMEQFGVPEGFNPSEDFESAHGEAWCQAIDAYMFWKSVAEQCGCLTPMIVLTSLVIGLVSLLITYKLKEFFSPFMCLIFLL